MRRHILGKLAPIAALLLALLPSLVAAGSSPRRASVHPGVWEALEADGEAEVLLVLREQADLSGADTLLTKEAKGRYVYEALRAVAERTQVNLRATLDAQGVDYQSFYIVNAVKVRTDSTRLRSLATRSDVARIVPNPWVKGVPDAAPQAASMAPAGIEPNLVRVNADDVWSLGYTGQGIVVAGQDTGYDWEHPALKDQYRGWDGTEVDHDGNWHDAIRSGGGVCGPDSPEPCDDHYHGTHTMGTIVGNDGAGQKIGMAPGAQWIGCRNMDRGYGTPATYMECFEFFLAPYPVAGTPAQGDPGLAPHVISNSWSCPPSEGCDADTLEATVEAVRQAGMAVVVSAGNEGYQGCGSVNNPPGLYRQSFSVAAFSHTSEEIAGFSSRGPVTYGGDTYSKPDITAPGVNVRSSLPGEGYGYSSGTSMAAPHVAGAVALLLSAAPGYSGDVDAIEQILTASAEARLDDQCGDAVPPNNVWGWGILDVLAAVTSITSGELRGTITDGSSGRPVAGALVVAVPVAGSSNSTTITDPTGHFSVTLAMGNYDVTVEADGYVPQTVTNTPVVSGQVTTLDFGLMPLQRLYIPLILRES